MQNAFGPVHKNLHTTCPKITHGVLILAHGGSKGHTKDWTATLENGPSPSALMGAVATGEGALPQPKAGLKSGGNAPPPPPPPGMVLLVVADIARFSQVTHASLATRDPTCHPPLRGLVSPKKSGSVGMY